MSTILIILAGALLGYGIGRACALAFFCWLDRSRRIRIPHRPVEDERSSLDMFRRIVGRR